MPLQLPPTTILSSFLSATTTSFLEAAAATMDSADPNLKDWIPQPISAQAYALPICGTMALVLLIIPFYYHLSLRSIGPTSLIFFISLANLFTVTNALLWPTDDYGNWYDGNVLCDIQAKLRWPIVTGVNAATTCITRNLALMFDTDRQIVAPTRGMRRRKMWTDILVCLGVPILQVALHYIIQDNRFYVEVIGGCAPSFDNSWPTILIMYIWPLLFCFGNCYYAALVIIRLRRHRSTALSSLAAHSLPLPLFLRLLFMSLLLLVLYLPLNIFFFYINVNIVWLPYSWDAIHSPLTWPHILYLPPLGPRTFDNWLPIIDAFAIILFLGMAGDALDLYRRLLLRVPYMAKWFPSLKEPRVAHGNRSHGESGSGLLSKFSLASRARAYFDSRKDSSSANATQTSQLRSHNEQFTTLSTSTTASAADSRKGSAIPTVNHINTAPLDYANSDGTATSGIRPHPSTQVPDFGTAAAGSVQTYVGVGTPVRETQSRSGEAGVRIEKRVDFRDEFSGEHQDDFEV